jgi:hypothetical protein
MNEEKEILSKLEKLSAIEVFEKVGSQLFSEKKPITMEKNTK